MGSKWLRSGSSTQTPVIEGGSNWKGAGMDVDGGGKSGIVNHDPKSKESGSVMEGKSSGNQEMKDMEEGNLAEDTISKKHK